MGSVVLDITDNIIIRESGSESVSNSGFKKLEDEDYTCQGWETMINANASGSNRTITLYSVPENETQVIRIFNRNSSSFKKVKIQPPSNYSFQNVNAPLKLGRKSLAIISYVGDNTFFVEMNSRSGGKVLYG